MSDCPLPPRDTALSLLRHMLAIRLFEERLFRAFKTEKMPGTMHQAIGQEAVAAGVGQAMRPDDLMTSTHRGHGHAIAKGLPLGPLMAEMYGRSTGTSGGMGGSMHLFDMPRGFLGTTGIVGAGVPIAVGAALAAQLDNSGQVAVAFFGDGGANQGAVHEALNLAAVWKLPVVFVCENNGYAVSIPVNKAFAIDSIAQRAAGYGMPGECVDGNDAAAVFYAAETALGRARAGAGPTLLECRTYRHKGHSRFEPGRYRPDGELDAWLARDPIELFRQRLAAAGLASSDEVEALRAAVAAEIEAAVEFAKASPPATAAGVASMVFA